MKHDDNLTLPPTLGLGIDFLNAFLRQHIEQHNVDYVVEHFPAQVENAYGFGVIDVLKEYPALLIPSRLEKSPYLSCWVSRKEVRDFWSANCVYTPNVCASVLQFDPLTLLKMPISTPLFYAYCINSHHLESPGLSVNLPTLPESVDLHIPWSWNTFQRGDFWKALNSSALDGWLIMEFYERYISDDITEAYTDRKQYLFEKVPVDKRNYWLSIFDISTHDSLIQLMREQHRGAMTPLDIDDGDLSMNSTIF